MPKYSKENTKQKKLSVISEQISFRHSKSVKIKTIEISQEENLGIADTHRKIFNAGLKSLYGITVRGNQIVN